jgi:hypothetical protein
VLTDEQYKRLPALLREIVDCDRELDAIRSRTVVSFDRSDRPMREFELIGLRAGLTHGAAQIWGTQIGASGGPQHG